MARLIALMTLLSLPAPLPSSTRRLINLALGQFRGMSLNS
jgi:hypothetical protein